MSDHTSNPKQTQEIRPGYCHCGCGQKTNIAEKNHTRLGHVKGKPYRFLPGHYARTRPRQKIKDRFWAKVNKDGPIHPVLGTPCWEWQELVTSCGYGRFTKKRGHMVGAHRVSWEIHNGPIPDGLHVLHHCDNPPCVNPSHLFLGTAQDNADDKVAKGRQRRGRNHPNSTITEKIVREVRRLAADGMMNKEIGLRLGLEERHVGKIVRRELWKHVKEKS